MVCIVSAFSHHIFRHWSLLHGLYLFVWFANTELHYICTYNLVITLWYLVPSQLEMRWYKLEVNRNVPSVDASRGNSGLHLWKCNCQSASDRMDSPPQQPSSPAKTTKVDLKKVLHHLQLSFINSFSMPTYYLSVSWGGRRLSQVYKWWCTVWKDDVYIHSYGHFVSKPACVQGWDSNPDAPVVMNSANHRACEYSLYTTWPFLELQHDGEKPGTVILSWIRCLTESDSAIEKPIRH